MLYKCYVFAGAQLEKNICAIDKAAAEMLPASWAYLNIYFG